jgi:hypothetical protein
VNKEQPTYPKSPKVQNAIKAPYYANFTTHLLKRKEEGGCQLASWQLPAAGKEKSKKQKINLADKAGFAGRLKTCKNKKIKSQLASGSEPAKRKRKPIQQNKANTIM